MYINMSTDNVPPYTTATEEPSALPNYLRARHVADVPQDVDFLMEHLNDPNFDLTKPVHVPRSDSQEFSEKQEKKLYEHSVDADSHFDSEPYNRPDSRNSSSHVDFDE